MTYLVMKARTFSSQTLQRKLICDLTQRFNKPFMHSDICDRLYDCLRMFFFVISGQCVSIIVKQLF